EVGVVAHAQPLAARDGRVAHGRESGRPSTHHEPTAVRANAARVAGHAISVRDATGAPGASHVPSKSAEPGASAIPAGALVFHCSCAGSTSSITTLRSSVK